MLRLAAERGLDLVQTARMLAMAHVAGGDAMIACFDAKYHYWFWRPYQAILLADTDGNPETVADPSWQPLGVRRTSPSTRRRTPATAPRSSRPSTHSSAPTMSRSRSTAASPKRPREYKRLHDIVKDVDWARVLVGFHFRDSDRQGQHSDARSDATSPTTTSNRSAAVPSLGTGGGA